MKPFLLFFFCIAQCTSLNIIFYMTIASKSHVAFFRTLVNILAERGHTVDVVIGHMNPALEWKGMKIRNSSVFRFPGESPWLKANHLLDPFQEQPRFQFDHYYETSTELCKIGLASGEPLKFVKNGNYDAMISSSYDYCGLIFAHEAGIKSVMTMSALNLLPQELNHLGLPNPVSCVADNFDSLRGSFSFFAKIRRAYESYHFKSTFAKFLNDQTTIARNAFGPNFPQVQELVDRIDVVFVNSNEVIEIPRTLSHKVQYLGGIALPHPKAVDEEFDHRLSISSKGTVLVSFGTQVPAHLVPFRVRKAFAYAFAKFPEYKFIWKHSAQPGDLELFGNVTNVEFVEWLPQTDLLYDPRIVGFITHSGLNSLLESSYAGVPMISIPLFADQMHNSRAAVRLGTGVDLHKVYFEGKDLEKALEKLLHGELMRQRAKEVARMINTRPNEPKRRFIEWVEFSAANPGFHNSVNLAEAKIGILEYYCVDVISVILLALFTYIFIVRACYLYLLQLVRSVWKQKIH